MGDHNNRRIGCQPLDGALNERFRTAIKGAGRLIEYENVRLADDCARDRNTLPLATRKLGPTIA